MRKYAVLDKGYVRLVTYTPHNMVALAEAIEDGDLERARMLIRDHELAVVNAAKASFMKESQTLGDKEIRLLRFLAEHGHSSPTRHAMFTFEIKAPLLVARQWFKYRIGSTHGPDSAELIGAPAEILEWFGLSGDDGGFDDPMYARNEASRRYVTIEPEFYIPDVWRGAPENKKQGSSGEVDPITAATMRHRLIRLTDSALGAYEMALKKGVCAEQARLFLPAYALYTVWRWSCSLQACCFFLSQRLAHDAQSEIREYAQAVYALVKPVFPRVIPDHES